MTVKKQTNSDIQSLLAEQTLSREQFAISKFLGTLRLQKTFWGVEEDTVWQILERLVTLYEDALTAERMRRELAERKLEAIQSRGEEVHG